MARAATGADLGPSELQAPGPPELDAFVEDPPEGEPERRSARDARGARAAEVRLRGGRLWLRSDANMVSRAEKQLGARWGRRRGRRL